MWVTCLPSSGMPADLPLALGWLAGPLGGVLWQIWPDLPPKNQGSTTTFVL